MTNFCGGAPDRFGDVAIGHGRSRDEALAHARRIGGADVRIVAECELDGTWTVLTRAPAAVRTLQRSA